MNNTRSALISNSDPIFVPCTPEELEGTKAFALPKSVGRERVLIVTLQSAIFQCFQYPDACTMIRKAVDRLSELHRKLEDRINGIVPKARRQPGILKKTE